MLLQAGVTALRVGSPDRLEMLLFQALTKLRQAPADLGIAVTRDVAVRVAPRPTFLAGRDAPADGRA